MPPCGTVERRCCAPPLGNWARQFTKRAINQAKRTNMPNLNKVMLIGNLTRDPETKYTPKGTCVCSFALAVNRNWTTDSGERREEVTFIDCEAYARLGEIVGEYAKKGRPLFVEGRLKLDTWDDKQSGQKRSKMKVVAETIQLLGGRPGGEGGGEHAGSEQQQQPQRRQPQQQPARGNSAQRPPSRMRPNSAPDPDLDAAPDDIPF